VKVVEMCVCPLQPLGNVLRSFVNAGKRAYAMSSTRQNNKQFSPLRGGSSCNSNGSYGQGSRPQCSFCCTKQNQCKKLNISITAMECCSRVGRHGLSCRHPDVLCLRVASSLSCDVIPPWYFFWCDAKWNRQLLVQVYVYLCLRLITFCHHLPQQLHQHLLGCGLQSSSA
jgi:hypothetical protein